MVRIIIYLESTHQGLQFEVLRDIVPKTLKYDTGLTFTNCKLTMKVMADCHKKTK